MQSFYPSPPLRGWGFALLAALVLALHGLGLQSLSGSWSRPKPPPSFEIRLQPLAPLATPTPPATAPAARPVRPQLSQAAGLHAAASALAKPATSSAPSTTVAPTAPLPSETATPSTSTSAKATPDPVPNPASEARPVAPPAPSNPTPEAVAASPSETGMSTTPFIWPPSVKLVYEFVGESKGIRYSADGDMLWTLQGSNYQLKQEVRHLLLGSRSQTSVGNISPRGLLPQRFGDKFKQEVAAHFERDKGLVSFSANTPSQALQDGAQDRLSLFVQLAALLAGSPQYQQPGQQFGFQVVSGRSAEVWAFSVDKAETLKLPIGSVKTLKLSRVPLQQYDQTVEMWLSPQHGFLPARVRIAQTNGDVLEQFLSKVQTP